MIRWQFIQKTAAHVVAGLPMQHARLGEGDMQTLSGAGHGDIHQSPLLLEPSLLGHCIFVREEAFLKTSDEHPIELQALGRMHRHELDGILTLLSLVVAGLERCMGEKRRQW